VSLRYRAPTYEPSTTGVPRDWESPSASAVFAWIALLLLLTAPPVTQASEGRQAPPTANSDEAERPAWLRPIGEETGSSTRPNSEPGDGGSNMHRAGWSKHEPGVRDVQAWDWLQQDLERIVDRTASRAPDRLSRTGFEAKFVEATTEFLEIGDEATRSFRVAVGRSLEEIDSARSELLQRKLENGSSLDETDAMLAAREGWAEYGKAQQRAARHPLAILETRPRHQLLREKMLTWLLRLDYGLSVAAQP
jgi:hypothetical protein